MINTIIGAASGDWSGVGAGIGGMVGSYVGWQAATGGAALFTKQAANTFLAGFLTGAIEFGAAGFGAGFGAALGSGASFGDAVTAGLITGGMGAVAGGIIQGSYMAGWQDVLHGASKDDIAKARMMYRAANGKPAISKNPFDLREELEPKGNWFVKWHPEGPLTVDHGEWVLKQTLPPQAFAEAGLFIPGAEVRGLFTRPVHNKQFGHFEFLGGLIKTASFMREWTTTEVGHGPVQIIPHGPSHTIMYLYDESRIKSGLYGRD